MSFPIFFHYAHFDFAAAHNQRLDRYHLKDVIVGKIYFLLVRIKIKHMELSIIRRETTGAVPNQYNESETITKFEIMDGAPVRGQSRAPVDCWQAADPVPDPNRRNDSNPVVLGRIRTDADVPGRQQEVLDSVLPQPRLD